MLRGYHSITWPQLSLNNMARRVNLTNLSKLAQKSVKLEEPAPAMQYFFNDYYSQLTGPLLINPKELGTRQHPTTSQGAITHRLKAL